MSYAPGTVVIPAERPVIATDRFDKFGNQILENTGLRDGYRDCILWRGWLYGADMAEHLRTQAARDAASELLTALESALEQMEQCEKMFRDDDEFMSAIRGARAAIAKATT